jgi:hypothetical protein
VTYIDLASEIDGKEEKNINSKCIIPGETHNSGYKKVLINSTSKNPI